MAERLNREAPSRRAFFRTVGLGAATAAGAAAGLADGTPAEAAKRPDGSLGYRETEHVKRVYETARF